MKKTTTSLVFSLLFIVLCLIPGIGLLITGGAEAGANEILAPKPRLTDRDGRPNGAVLTELADYIDDRFYLRQECVTAWAALNGLARSSTADDVILGSDGWLYFAQTLPDYTRSDPMTERELWCAARTLCLLQENAESRGGQFLFVIAPNKNSLYAESMPAYPRAEGSSDAERLLDALAEMDVRYLDLFRVFREQDETLYFPTDSHWNGRGAALAADAVLQALGRESGYFSGGFDPDEHRGDLYEMLYPAGKKRDLDWVYAPGFTFTADTRNADSPVIRTRGTGAGSLLMYRDSFGRNLYPYLAESFDECVFSRKNDYDPRPMAEGGCLAVELVERNLRYLNLYVPSVPAPARELSLAGDAAPAGSIELHREDGAENYVNLSGVFGEIGPDDRSPVYVRTGAGVFEAVPGPEGFSAMLPARAAQGDILIIFTAGGNLISLSGVL